jgi:hypothetical protein
MSAKYTKEYQISSLSDLPEILAGESMRILIEPKID